ncbi:MAG: hypothetical protein M0C28_44855 [Candidatus Moduliflexus flocculans]|nr:hypothetical protein [Candidatus Moduliflexus flocculans]
MGFRFLAGSDGASINHLVFEVDLAIMNGAAVSDVTIDHCTFRNAVQAVSNWRGNGWAISHNGIIDLRYATTAARDRHPGRRLHGGNGRKQHHLT